ncbi:uncharacterized protein LOC108669552 [Hyalella azteca]|uniref:Uncharacterized protein LOC108669552 n=1 Tax=Hyalella azteca TaxID=294128 RepID=A0A8B7NG73_HYAAZ|nr:uncharacterized protein LOC108669552 [Hyalella azteca]
MDFVNKIEVGISKLSEKDEIVSRNTITVTQLVPDVLRQVVAWASPDKDDAETYEQYIQRKLNRPLTKNDWKRLINHKDMKKVIEVNTNSADFDVTLLFSLMCAFHEISPRKDSKEEQEAFASFKRIKVLRNKIMHNTSDLKDQGKVEEIKTALIQLVTKSSITYEVSESDANKVHEEIKKRIDQIVTTKVMPHVEDNQVPKEKNENLCHVKTPNLIELNGACCEYFNCILMKKGLLDTKISQSTNFFHGMDIFENVEFGEHNEPESPISQPVDSRQLLSFEHEQVVILIGALGCGKTALLENLTFQFYDAASKVDYLSKFQLLIYYDCSDRAATSVEDVVEHCLRKLCLELGASEIVQEILSLKTLFLVYASNDMNRDSSRVIEDLLRKVPCTECKVLISTISQKVLGLSTLIKKLGLKETGFRMKPIENLNDQKTFLRNYSRTHSEDEKKELLENFNELNKNVRDCFQSPVSLQYLCQELLKDKPRLGKTTQVTDVAPDLYVLYRELLVFLLQRQGICNCKRLSDDLLVVIGEFALQQIHGQMNTISEEQLSRLERLCRQELKNYDAAGSALAHLAADIVLIKKGNTRSFQHESVQEYFAAKYIVRRLCDMRETLESIMMWRPKPMTRMRNVLVWVIKELSSEEHKTSLNYRWEELRQAMQKAGADFDTWTEVLKSCGDNKKLKEAVEKERSVAWLLENEDDAKRMARFLTDDERRMARFLTDDDRKAIRVNLDPATAPPAEWGSIIENFTGKIELDFSREIDSPCDAYLSHFNKATCQVTYFNGCIQDKKNMDILKTVAAPTCKLEIMLKASESVDQLNI